MKLRRLCAFGLAAAMTLTSFGLPIQTYGKERDILLLDEDGQQEEIVDGSSNNWIDGYRVDNPGNDNDENTALLDQDGISIIEDDSYGSRITGIDLQEENLCVPTEVNGIENESADAIDELNTLIPAGDTYSGDESLADPINADVASGNFALDGNWAEGYLANVRDTKTYSINVAAAGWVTLTVKVLGGTNESAKSSVVCYISQKDKGIKDNINKTNVSGKKTEPGSQVFNTLVEAGSYDIIVERPITTLIQDNKDVIYKIKGEFTPAGNNEIEPNNYFDSAMELSDNQQVDGLITKTDKIDFYAFKVSTKRNVSVFMTARFSDSQLQLYNADFEKLDMRNAGFNGTENNPYSYYMKETLTPGKYYLRVGRDFWNRGSEEELGRYSIKVKGIDLIKYPITYDYGYPNPITVKNPETYNSSQTITFKNPKRTGYDFEGWFEGETKVTKIPKGSSGSRNLKARWIAHCYNLSFKPNGKGVTGSIPTRTGILYSDDIILPDNVYERTGYAFDGWSLNSNGKEPVYMGGARVSGLTPKNKATISMYAKWNPIEYRINYELNGGSQPVNKKGEITNPRTHLYDKSVSLKNPVRIGYTFGGWFDNPEFAGKKMTSIPIKIAAPVTVYAKWTPIKYTINFSANGGKGKMASIKNVEYDSMVMLTPNDFTKNGYTFQGWSLSKNGEVEYRDRSQVNNLRTTNGSVTLYAKWTKD